jgi:hypothetical protein
MQFSSSFFVHFILSFLGFILIGIYLCRGSWRNRLRLPLALAVVLILTGHLFDAPEPFRLLGFLLLPAFSLGSYFFMQRNSKFIPSEVREGHNVLSLLVGAALFALTVQLHSVLFGVPVFQLVK